METPLLSTAYLPPIQYFSKLYRHSAIYLERYENFGKQSYRNRCNILTANGVISLTVPVEKANSKTLSKDIRIVYQTPWQKLHFKGIESAYKNSPYYEYYIDDILPFFEKKETFLWDWNLNFLESMMEILQWERTILFTEDYIRPGTPSFKDFRDTIHPKPSHQAPDPEFVSLPYRQTFSDRFSFVPNLSILDLLFCTGPEASKYL